jgi:hypothetical protein
MTLRAGACLVIVASIGSIACQIHVGRPATIPTRTIEPQVLEPQGLERVNQGGGSVGEPISVRLLDTQARGQIGRKVLHQQPNGELTEDSVWRWSSAPDRYLDTALRLELAANSQVRLVDAAGAGSLAATLLAWETESSGETRLVGVVEFQFIGTNRVVHTEIVRASEPISAELPGNLAAAAGSLMRHLASEGVKRMVNQK